MWAYMLLMWALGADVAVHSGDGGRARCWCGRACC